MSTPTTPRKLFEDGEIPALLIMGVGAVIASATVLTIVGAMLGVACAAAVHVFRALT